MLMTFHLETATEVHFIITIAAHFKDLTQSQCLHMNAWTLCQPANLQLLVLYSR